MKNYTLGFGAESEKITDQKYIKINIFLSSHIKFVNVHNSQ